MSAFAEEAATSVEKETAAPSSSARSMVDYSSPVSVVYHPSSGIPAEFCEFSETFEKDLPWILANCPEAVTPDVLAKMLAKATLGEEGAAEEGGKKEKEKGGGISAKKVKAGPGECRVVIARIQRQKRKFVTSVTGMDTVPDCRPKVG